MTELERAETIDAPPRDEQETDRGAAETDVDRARVRAKLFAGRHEAPKIGRYAVLSRIGSGAIGHVYAGYDAELDRRVAIKLLSDPNADETSQQRFVREAQALARLSHPNVVPVYEVGEHLGQRFIAMEYVKGKTLREVADGDPPWSELLSLYVQAGRGLAAAHAAGIVHRDFKPDNVLVGEDGRVRVVDFGLAQAHSGAAAVDVDASLRSGDVLAATVTSTGVILGTPAYMAPEQFGAEDVTALSDQFSFCVALFEAIYRERPFPGRTALELSVAVRGGDRSPVPEGRDIPGSIRAALDRGLGVDPKRRFASMDALLAELARDPGRPRRRVILGAAGVLAVGGAYAYGARSSDDDTCADVGAAVTRVWNEQRRRAVTDALAAAAVPYANDTAAAVAQRLDAYAQAWIAERRTACAARDALSDAELDRRTACLDARARELETTADILAEPGAAERAVEIAGGLRPAADCSDPRYLDAEVEPPLADVAAEVDAVRAELDRARVLLRAARYDETDGTLVQLLARAEATAYAPLLAEVQHQRGLLLEARGTYEDAAAALQASYGHAIIGGHDRLAAEASELALLVDGARLAHADAAALWEGIARASATRAGLSADAMQTSLGAVAAVQGRYDDAVTHYRAALAHEEEGDAEPLAVARAHHNLGSALGEAGALDEARASFEAALKIREQTLGPDHPRVADTLINLGGTLPDPDAALAALQRALAIQEKALGPEHPALAQSLKNLAVLEARAEDREGAVARLERAQRIERASLRPGHPQLGHTATNLCAALGMVGRWDASAQQCRSAVEILAAAVGDDHEDTAVARANLGGALLELRRFDEAERSFRAAITALSGKPDDPRLAYAQTGLAQALWPLSNDPPAAPRRDEAVALTLAARRIYAAAGEDVAELDAWLGSRGVSEPAR